MGMRGWARANARHVSDVALAAVMAVTAQYEIWVGPLFDDGIPGPQWANSVLLGLITIPLVRRRRHPTVVFAIVVTAAALQASQIDARYSDQPAIQLWLALLVVFYSVAAHAARRHAVVAGAVGGAAFVIADVVALATGGAGLEETVPAWFLIAAAWGLGFTLRGTQAQATVLLERSARLERERQAHALAAVAEERQRIARELHDVVAHSISVMVVHAEAAERVLEGPQPSARESLRSIETTGRQTLGEMRRLVTMLRTDDEEGEPLAPQPSLEHLGLLIEQVRDAGLAVEVRIVGDIRILPPGVELAVYRIIQEALTNTLKHAGSTHAEVSIDYQPDEVRLEVRDYGRGSRGAPDGHGLVGMRERVGLYGGTLRATAVDGSGFTVHARLPT